MTSEVAIMNRLGIALASDSASTVHIGGRTKYYHADKLFMLSAHQPVGIMVFNNSTLLGVPWETIIKLFRAKLGHTRLDYLSEYAGELIDFLNSNTDLFPPEVQQRHYLNMLDTFFGGLNIKINAQAQLVVQVARADGQLKSDVREIEAAVVQEALEEWQKKPDVNHDQCPRDIAEKVVGEQSGKVHELILNRFSFADRTVMTTLYELARLIISKETILEECLSGLVIAGFGEKEHFPAMEQYHVGEIYQNRLKYTRVATWSISSDVPAVIRPFAQSDMASTFLDGVSPAYQLKVLQELVGLGDMLPAEIFSKIPMRGKAQKDALRKAAEADCLQKVRELIGRLNEFKETEHLTPIVRSIEYLPKDELAHVAASLVNLNSLQKRISFSEDETVGGPIDVAVISKGDGFIWIDRKHYFKPELNRHFFRNRMEEELHDRTGESDEDHHVKGSRHGAASEKVRSRGTPRGAHRK
jgi:hypothetical protein